MKAQKLSVDNIYWRYGTPKFLGVMYWKCHAHAILLSNVLARTVCCHCSRCSSATVFRVKRRWWRMDSCFEWLTRTAGHQKLAFKTWTRLVRYDHHDVSWNVLSCCGVKLYTQPSLVPTSELQSHPFYWGTSGESNLFRLIHSFCYHVISTCTFAPVYMHILLSSIGN